MISFLHRFRFSSLIFVVIIASCAPVMGEEAAVTEHWKRPIASSPSLSAKDLLPDRCGACHMDQLRDWSGSLHSKSMGPGLLFQLDPLADPGTATACYFCHAPLVAQSEIVSADKSSGKGAYVKNRDFDERLRSTGVSCGVCHARGGLIRGPLSPKLEGLKKGVSTDHDVRQKGFFEQAEFCAACHQLKDGFRLNGKLLVDTYDEWKKSSFGRAGITCQNCHMPGRRHLFRGIHDGEMAKSGIKTELSIFHGNGSAVARLAITNTGAGHYYPTYATPLIIVKGYLADAAGRMLKGTSLEAYIGRSVALDLSEEFFDTRIAPLDTLFIDYPLKDTDGAKRVVFTATVYPDEFYKRFYEYSLTVEMSVKKKSQLQAAYDRSSNSAYELFKKELALR